MLNQYHTKPKAKNVQLHDHSVTSGGLCYNWCATLQLVCYITTAVLQDQFMDNFQVVTELVNVTKLINVTELVNATKLVSH
jgi:hypothetical protein